MQVTEELAQKVIDTIRPGLSCGMGTPSPGNMCVEAAVCYAMGLPHSDKPRCVHKEIREFKIILNDAGWVDSLARAKGMLRVAVAQLGSDHLHGATFVDAMRLYIGKEIVLPMLQMPHMAERFDRRQRYEEIIHVLQNGLCNELHGYQVLRMVALQVLGPISLVMRNLTDGGGTYVATAGIIALSHISSNRFGVVNQKGLADLAEHATKVLIGMGTEGSKFLYLCEEK